MARTRMGFKARSLYKVKRASAFRYAKQKLSFVVASLSLMAFVMGNMVGQHGWYAFWKSVLGKDIDATIVFTGTVPPIAKVPDYSRWSIYGGGAKDHTYRQVPESMLVPLPEYDISAMKSRPANGLAERVFSVANLGDYSKGNDHGGSHVGVDISVPMGTPVLAIANGIIDSVKLQNYGFGNHIVLRIPNAPDPASPGHFTTLYAVYAHLDSIIVTEGDKVTKGGQIGLSGMTGDATGPHLHFQIELADAPYHPYWPFTTAELAEAGLTFRQAVNSGFHQERGDLYTVSPLVFVQEYINYVPTARVAAIDSAAVVEPPAPKLSMLSPKERLALRRAERLKLLEIRNQRVAATVVSSVNSSNFVASSASSASAIRVAANEEITVPAVISTGGAVDHLVIEHDGDFDRSWQKIYIRAIGTDGKTLASPSFSDRLYLVTTFGEADIRPSNQLRPTDFVNGTATVNILPRSGLKTLKFETKSANPALRAESAPMIYAKE